MNLKGNSAKTQTSQIWFGHILAHGLYFLGASLHFSKCSCTDLLKFRFLAPIITGCSRQAPLINEPDSSLFKGNLHKGYIPGGTDP